MGDNSAIEWTDATWNPVRGCSRVSEGCDNCYAMRQARRQDVPGGAYEGLTRIGKNGVDWSGVVRLDEETLKLPLRWRRPRRIFVNSMADLFHPALSDEEIARVFAVMGCAGRHTYQVLTKRPERMARWFETPEARWAALTRDGRPLPNVWLGVSVENQQVADERIPWLLRTPAAVRFLSCEPLLGPLDIARWLAPPFIVCGLKGTPSEQAENLHAVTKLARLGAKGAAVPLVDWVIAGCESGPRRRPCDDDWLRSLRDQCQAAGVAFFLKQKQSVAEETVHVIDITKTPRRDYIEVRYRTVVEHAPALDGRQWLEYPEVARG